jgi:membrane-associated phospholipid phosphatase
LRCAIDGNARRTASRAKRLSFAAICTLAAATGLLGIGTARAQDSADRSALAANAAAGQENQGAALASETGARDVVESVGQNSNSLGVPFLKSLLADQRAIWTSPAHLRWADATWLFPLAALTGGFLATDRAVPPALSSNPAKLNHYTSISNYGVYAFVGAGAGLYAWSKFSHDERQRETGILAGEAAIDSLAADAALKHAFRRERPGEGAGLGRFSQGSASFPSDHSALAWSIASVVAHEYPGPVTQFAAYGLATAVSASRVLGKQHFPSDVVVGAALGWFIGREVYRAHHDIELGGGGSDTLSASEAGEDRRERTNMGSPFVPLDDWVYPAFERLVALGYIRDAILGLKPWTRLECARLTEEAGEALPAREDLSEEAARLESRLENEFAFELSLLGGGRNFTARVESVYARAVSISGPPLSDGYHFGQTVAYDFGRPFERGASGQVGGSFRGSAGPLTFYVRAEYQHAPAAPAPSAAIVNLIAFRDIVPVSKVPASAIAAVNRPRFLDAYAGVTWNNWQLLLGQQTLSWGPSADPLVWSDNAEPIKMVRLVTQEPFTLPGFLGTLAGPTRIDMFFGRLEGHAYVPRPFVYGQKINFRPFSFLEVGLGRRTMIGGTGSGNALTAGNLLYSLVGRSNPALKSVPGDNDSEMDWVLYIPKVRNYLLLYGEGYAEDDILPIQNPARSAWHPGIYLTRIPGVSRLDFHIQAVSTEDGALANSDVNNGRLDFYNGDYPDGNTNNGVLLGNTVGREGRAIRCWFTYWLSPEDTIRFSYQHNSVSADFIPGGGLWADYGVRAEKHFRNGFYVKPAVQFEHIARYPALFQRPENNVTATFELGFIPGRGQ